jgi:hypothetical protein
VITRVHVGRADDAPGFRVLVPEVRFHHFLSACKRARKVCFNEGKCTLLKLQKVVTFLIDIESSRVDAFDYSLVFGICDEFITTCMCIVLELQMNS